MTRRATRAGNAADHVAVIGASLAGHRTVEALRNNGFDGRITLVGAESHLPYDRPPLSKRVLLDPEPVRGPLLTDGSALAALGVDLHLGQAAVELRPGATWSVLLEGGDRISCDRVVLATGAAAIQPLRPQLEGVHALRTLEDAVSIRSALTHAERVVVVGGGFIGAEVASAARAHGRSVTIIEALATPLARAVGEVVGGQSAALHRRNGVGLRCGVAVRALEGDTRVSAVRLADGERIPADLVVVGVGAAPQTAWLEGAGVTIDDGVVCDEYGAAHPSGTVFAVGDVSRWWHPRFERNLRVEHWAHAVEQAQVVAHNVVHPEPRPLQSVPYAWSDQHGVKIQIAGLTSAEHDLWMSSPDSGPELTALYGRDGHLEGAVAFGRPRTIALARRLIAERARIDEALDILAPPDGLTRVHGTGPLPGRAPVSLRG